MALGSFFFGYECSVINSIYKTVEAHFFPNKDHFQMIFFIAIIPLTAIIGSLFIYITLVCKFGRRKIALITDYLSIIGIIVTLVGI